MRCWIMSNPVMFVVARIRRMKRNNSKGFRIEPCGIPVLSNTYLNFLMFWITYVFCFVFEYEPLITLPYMYWDFYDFAKFYSKGFLFSFNSFRQTSICWLLLCIWTAPFYLFNFLIYPMSWIQISPGKTFWFSILV